ncbi:MAG: hypothetical protein KatS3mg118_2525 [Paracoccaceae bacterium]|nr:MAG: hypothetical protein KatS3mg118_2525 [Paracoccaceae bacterium]
MRATATRPLTGPALALLAMSAAASAEMTGEARTFRRPVASARP